MRYWRQEVLQYFVFLVQRDGNPVPRTAKNCIFCNEFPRYINFAVTKTTQKAVFLDGFWDIFAIDSYVGSLLIQILNFPSWLMNYSLFENCKKSFGLFEVKCKLLWQRLPTDQSAMTWRGQAVEALSSYLRFIFYLVIHKIRMKSIWRAHDQQTEALMRYWRQEVLQYFVFLVQWMQNVYYFFRYASIHLIYI